ncbi:MAG: penicillin acylase family protein, partial [Lysobacteraceae bacterium]
MLRWFKRGALVLLLLIMAVFGTGWWLLHGSVATMDGTQSLTGLSAPVQIERDALGVVTIHAANQTDAMRALGYVHAQERFFEMDLLRRSAAGELSELFGSVAVDLDKSRRVHRLRARLHDGQLATFAGNAMPQLTAYTEGVNAGLAGLSVRPWPYLLLRSQPAPWLAEDSALAVDAMFFDLQGGNNKDELTLWRIRQSLPPALFTLLSSDGTQWDAPLQGQPRGDVALPDTATLDLRTLPAPGIDGNPPYVDADKPGSNNFAVSGALTADGRAILANDMHLSLRAPNIWFRARLVYPDAQSPVEKVDISGFTLPGVPGVVVGSNTHVAWGFTNSYGDWMDWVEDCAPADAACDTAEKTLHETIRIKGTKSFELKVVETAFGTRTPDITGRDAKLSLAWTAHRPGALTMGLGAMGTVTTTASAVEVLNHAGIPAQNAMIVDSQGHIAWTIAGRIPDKHADFGCNRAAPSRIPPPPSAPPPPGTPLPAASADSPCTPWSQWAESNPSIIDPPSHRLWTANNRVSDAADLAAIGDSGYDLGARAKQIRDDLFAKEQFNERDLLAIQLDDRALFLQRWWLQLRALVQ